MHLEEAWVMVRGRVGLWVGLIVVLAGMATSVGAQEKADPGDKKDKKTDVVVSGTPAAVPDASAASADDRAVDAAGPS